MQTDLFITRVAENIIVSDFVHFVITLLLVPGVMLSLEAKLLVYQSVYVTTLTYGHELWVMTERTRLQIHSAKMRFLLEVPLESGWA